MKIKKIDLDDEWHYEGEVSQYNEPHGKGTLTNKKNKNKHIGKFKNGAKHGEGTTILSDGLKLSGKWKNNIIPEFGIYEYPDGQKYEGELKDGKYHGKGTLTMPDGTIVKAIFKESEIVKELERSNPSNDLMEKKILKNLKIIIKILEPKLLSNGEWFFKKPTNEALELFKSDKDLGEMVANIVADPTILEKLIKKFKIKYNYKSK